MLATYQLAMIVKSKKGTIDCEIPIPYFAESTVLFIAPYSPTCKMEEIIVFLKKLQWKK